MEAIHTVTFGQNIFDIALMRYGDASKAVKLYCDNLEVLTSFNMPLITGMKLIYTVTNNDFTRFVNDKKIIISTNDTSIKEPGSFDNSFDGSFN